MDISIKQSHDCRTMTAIRQAIDTIDHKVISLWARRFEYVKAAVAFKTDATAVRAQERFATMLAQRRQWAADKGLNPDVIEGLYRDLVNHFIDEEMKYWQQQG